MRKWMSIAALIVVLTALLTPLVSQACGGGPVVVDAPPTRLAIGAKAMVDTSLKVPLVLRDKPDIYGAYLDGLVYGTNLTVVDGPVRSANGYLYWKVAVAGSQASGWVAEGENTVYWIKPQM